MPEDSPLRVLITVRGTVQGVGFRWWTKRLADSLGITGSVRNSPDGSVVIEARGVRHVLSRFEEELRGGPPGAMVVSVISRPLPDGPVPAGFEITFPREEQ